MSHNPLWSLTREYWFPKHHTTTRRSLTFQPLVQRILPLNKDIHPLTLTSLSIKWRRLTFYFGTEYTKPRVAISFQFYTSLTHHQASGHYYYYSNAIEFHPHNHRLLTYMLIMKQWLDDDDAAGNCASLLPYDIKSVHPTWLLKMPVIVLVPHNHALIITPSKKSEQQQCINRWPKDSMIHYQNIE